MPKIIANLKERLMAEVRKQIEESGYDSMTIRSVAKACGVGVGTVYNYFRSKEELVATHLLDDWRDCVAVIQRVSEQSETPQPVLQCIYAQLTGFAGRHEAIFHAEAAVSSFAGSFSQYHDLLRSQLAVPLRRFCDSDFTSSFIAESLLTWTMAGKPFCEIYEILQKLF